MLLAESNAPLLQGEHAPVGLVQGKINHQPLLNFVVAFFPDVPFQDLPVHVFAVRVIAGPEVFFDRYLGRNRHTYTITRAQKAGVRQSGNGLACASRIAPIRSGTRRRLASSFSSTP